MAKKGFDANEIIESLRRIVNTKLPKDKLASATEESFSDSNQSLKEGLSDLFTGKRKSSICPDDVCPLEKRVRTESSSTPVSTLPSSWEAKMLKSDLIAVKAQISHYETRLNKQKLICEEMKILYDMEKSSFTDQHKRDERRLEDMNYRLEFILRRERELKEDYNQVKKERNEDKYKWDVEKMALQKQIADLKDKLLECEVSNRGQQSEMQKDMEEFLLALQGSQSEVEILKKAMAKQYSTKVECTTLKNLLEKKSVELQIVTNKLSRLEYERDTFIDWQQNSKSTQDRLVNMMKLEKEVVHLRTQERNLREAIGNKLLLEEQAHLLQCRVDTLLPVQNELHEAKVKVASLESSLEDWERAARAHGVENARGLASALESALNSQLNASAASSEAHSQLAELNEEVASLKFERDKAMGKLNELVIVHKNQESLIHRLQKRLQTVTRERDSYRQQLDCYEKELAVTLSGEAGVGSATLLTTRVEQLEKALQEYRDLLGTYDTTAHTKLVETLQAELSKWREEAETLKREIVKVRAQRDTLHVSLERIGAHSQTEVTNDEAQKQIQAELQAAQDELKQLKASMQEGDGSSASEEIQLLKQELEQQLESNQIQLQRLTEEVTASTQEYREVCIMLLGYKIDRVGAKDYRVTNMYAESAEEYLTFTLDDEGIEMIHSDYTSTLGDLVELHLQQHRSIPLFLSAVTMELFTRAAMLQV